MILENEKSDAAKTYKMTAGYQPGIAAMGREIVFIEGRGGNTPAACKMDETLKECFKGLKDNSIHIEYFRSDSAACQQPVAEEAEKNCTYIYIRIDDSQSLRDAIKDIPQTEWKPAIINNKKAEIADTPFFPFNGKKAYRAVVKRRKRKDKQFDVFTQSPYAYYAIMANHETAEATNLYVTEFYNKRGDIQKLRQIVERILGLRILDNYPFYLKKIPAHTFMCFTKNDSTYHKPSDELKTLDFVNMSRLVKGLLPGIEAIVEGVETPKN